MPLYSYRCKKCNHKFDYLLMDKDEKVTCPSCRNGDLEKLISSCFVGGSSKTPPMPPSCPSGGCGGGKCGL